MNWMAATGPHNLHILRDVDELRDWKRPWEELASKCGSDGFFCEHVFILQSWQRHSADKGKNLHIILIERDGDLLFAMPLVRKREWPGTSSLRFLDSKTPLYNSVLVSQHIDPDTVVTILREHLHSIPWCRELKLGFVPDRSSLAQLVHRLHSRTKPYSTSFALDLTPFSSWEDYLAKRGSRSRQEYRRLMRRLGDSGRVEVERIGDENRMRGEIAWIFARKREWVVRRFGEENWISPPETESWFQATAAELSTRGQAFALRLSCGGRRIAALLMFRSCETLFLSKIAYDFAWAKFSPGWLLNLEAIKLGFCDSIERIDFMIGHDQWKDRLASETCVIEQSRLALPLFPLRHGYIQ